MSDDDKIDELLKATEGWDEVPAEVVADFVNMHGRWSVDSAEKKSSDYDEICRKIRGAM